MRLFVLGIFYIAPAIDSITGYFMGVSGEENAISKVYRIIAFIVLYFAYFKAAGMNKVTYQILLSVYSILLLIYYLLLGGSFVIDCSYVIKLFYPIILIAMSKILYEKQQLGVASINKIINYYSFIYPASIIILAILGIGHSAYGGSVSNGHMGLFSGGNEISIVLAILFMIDMQRLYTSKTNKKFVVYVVLLGFSLLMTQTKTSYIVVTATIVLFIVKKIRKNPQNIYRNIMLVIIIAMCITLYFYVQQDQVMIMISRLTFKYHQLDHSFLNMLFSNRQNKILPIMKENFTFNIKGIQNFLFGSGFYLQVLEKQNNTFGLVEMDLVDILFQNGFIMLCIVLRFYWRIVKQAIKSRDIFMLFVYIMALIYAAFAGHVLYNPLSSTTLALLCIYVYANKNPLLNGMRRFKAER